MPIFSIIANNIGREMAFEMYVRFDCKILKLPKIGIHSCHLLNAYYISASAVLFTCKRKQLLMLLTPNELDFPPY